MPRPWPSRLRVIVEKFFGHDMASARELNQVARTVFPEDSIFGIDHFLGKEAEEKTVTSLVACGSISILAGVFRWSWDMPS